MINHAKSNMNKNAIKRYGETFKFNPIDIADSLPPTKVPPSIEINFGVSSEYFITRRERRNIKDIKMQVRFVINF
ncbi:hypothetical protein ACFL5N_01360 [bacterium]